MVLNYGTHCSSLADIWMLIAGSYTETNLYPELFLISFAGFRFHSQGE